MTVVWKILMRPVVSSTTLFDIFLDKKISSHPFRNLMHLKHTEIPPEEHLYVILKSFLVTLNTIVQIRQME